MDDFDVEVRPQEQPEPAAQQPCPLGEVMSVLDTLPLACAILDNAGEMQAANQAWAKLADKGAGLGSLHPGQNCLRDGLDLAPDILAGIRSVAEGRRSEFVRRDMRCAAGQN